MASVQVLGSQVSDQVRAARLQTVLRGLFWVSLVAIPTPGVGLFGDGTVAVSLAMMGLIAMITVVYGVALVAARSGRIAFARVITFAMWTSTPVSFLALYDDAATSDLKVIVLLLGTLTLSVFQNGMLALGTWREARPWIVGGVGLFALGLVWLTWRQDFDPAYSFGVLTICLFFSVATAWPARTILADLEVALATSETANQAKSRFLANMSHELRTPLNAILGYVGLVREESPDTTLRELDADLERIEQSGSHLLSIIGAILDLTKIEADEVRVTLESVDVTDLLSEIIDTVQPLARRQSLAIELDAWPMTPLVTDRSMLRQIVVNLVGNAIKYTPEGTITVAARTWPETVTVEVRDTGVGIHPDHLHHVFEPFERTDAAITQKVGGTGLGLALSKRLADRLGGSLTVESELGSGSCFTLRLPRVGGAPSSDLAGFDAGAARVT